MPIASFRAGRISGRSSSLREMTRHSALGVRRSGLGVLGLTTSANRVDWRPGQHLLMLAGPHPRSLYALRATAFALPQHRTLRPTVCSWASRLLIQRRFSFIQSPARSSRPSAESRAADSGQRTADSGQRTADSEIKSHLPLLVIALPPPPRCFRKNASIRSSVYIQRLCSIDSCVSSGNTISSYSTFRARNS
jgi:hypothetical protein